MRISKKQEYELLASISGRGEIPTKFNYLDGGEKRWDAYYKEQSSFRGKANEELSLIISHIDSVINVYKDCVGVNIIDLGCGNGIPAARIIDEFVSRGLQVVYVPVDLSKEMIETASITVGDHFPGMEIKGMQIDFEKESLTDHVLNLKQENSFPNLLLNLGNTLGNYVNVGSVLSNFLESMTLEDYLLVGNGIANDYNSAALASGYQNEITNKLVLGPVTSLGLYDEEDSLKWIWNSTKNRVESRVIFGNDKSIVLADQKIEFLAGEELMTSWSHKYSEPSFTKLFSDIGFRTEMLTTTKDRNHILTLVQPTRYSVS